jgi:muramoyltetrapeptide carboxypeptidase LdcA involved in peptidoglycan recycling
MKLTKPKALQQGDTIAFLAPASGLAALTPHRLEKAVEFFEKKGYKVKLFPTATLNEGESSTSAKERAEDLNVAFKDQEVKAIITTVGGNTCHETFEYIDFEMIEKNPKIFCGYSDITSLHFALRTQANLVTFYGPAVIVEFGETLDLDDYTVEYFFKALSGKVGEVEVSTSWSDCRKADWIKKEDLEIKRKYRDNKGYEWLREGKVSGKVLGGCLPTLLRTLDTKYFPSFKEKILFLETPESLNDFRKGESLEEVEEILKILKEKNILKEIKGLVLGRTYGYTDEETEEFKKLILEYTQEYKYPILYGIDCGHSDPMITIPLGAQISLDSEKNLFSIDESGVE